MRKNETEATIRVIDGVEWKVTTVNPVDPDRVRSANGIAPEGVIGTNGGRRGSRVGDARKPRTHI